MNYRNFSSEKKTSGSLVAYIDLLFLLVCFFVVLLYNTTKEAKQKQAEVELVEQQIDSATQVISKLKPLAEAGLTYLENRENKAKKEEEKKKRFLTRKVLRVEYIVLETGNIRYKELEMPLSDFMMNVVAPARENYWLSFRSYADALTPFGKVIEVRKYLLKDRNEFDTYWSNLQEK